MFIADLVLEPGTAVPPGLSVHSPSPYVHGGTCSSMSLFFVESLNGFSRQPRPSESLGFPAREKGVDKAKSESHGVFLVMGPADNNQVNK